MPAVIVEPMNDRGRQDLLDELAREEACLVDLNAQRDRACQRLWSETLPEGETAKVFILPQKHQTSAVLHVNDR